MTDKSSELFDLVYIDPPWPHAKRNEGTKFGLGANNYDLMELDDICNIKIGEITKRDAMLAMWVTGPFLERGFKAINSWGFKYCTIGFTWVKVNKKNGKLLDFLKNVDFKNMNIDEFNLVLMQMLEIATFKGPGNYTKANAEFCLLAKKGKGLSEGRGEDGLNMTIRDRTVRQILFSPILSPHSRKPDEARKRLKSLFGNDRKAIEIFAREQSEGWTAIGNSLTGNDVNFDIEKILSEIGVKNASISLQV